MKRTLTLDEFAARYNTGSVPQVGDRVQDKERCWTVTVVLEGRIVMED